jgi:hypothetical protein
MFINRKMIPIELFHERREWGIKENGRGSEFRYI